MYKRKYTKYKQKYLNLKRIRKIPGIQNVKDDLPKYRDVAIPKDLDPHYLGDNYKFRLLVSNIRFNDIEEDNIVNTVQKWGRDKILYLNTVNGFDDFTDKYGIIDNGKLFIRWADVANDYKGFGMDGTVNNDLYNKRFNKAFFEHNIYKSWWKREFTDQENNLIEFLE